MSNLVLLLGRVLCVLGWTAGDGVAPSPAPMTARESRGEKPYGYDQRVRSAVPRVGESGQRLSGERYRPGRRRAAPDLAGIHPRPAEGVEEPAGEPRGCAPADDAGDPE